MPFPPYTEPYSPNVLFTTRAEIERVLSFRGVELHIDDLDDFDDNWVGGEAEATDENAVTEIIQRVTSKILDYLAPRYSAETLATIPQIREIATYWACHDLSRRRGNEPLYEDEVAEGIERLERYREGNLYLDAPMTGPRTVVQAYVTDNRYYRNPTRVLRAASTAVVSSQRLAWEYPFFWI